MFYPKSQIKTNLSTNGGEYIYASNKLPYSGDYFITGDGKIYTGKNPNNKPNYLLIPTSINLTEAPNPEGETLPSSYYIADDYYYYAKGININSIGPPPSLPTQIFPTPTEKDYQIGEIQRYFVKKINEIKYIEINQEEFEQYLNQQSTVSYQLYIPFSFPWVLTGNRSNAYKVNKKTIERVQTNNRFQGLKSYFNGKYDQLFKYSPDENLYTDGTKFLNPLNRKPYIGFYHIGPEGKPMEGPQHTDKPHSFLIPISETYKTESTGSTYVTQSWYDLRYGGLNGPIFESPKPIVPTPPNLSFTTTWRTTSNNETITIGLDPSETYNFTVNWGDDSEETITSNSDLSHTYSNSGDYSVRIDGTFPRIMMGRPIASPNNLISINNWGNIEWVSMNNAFRDCINLYRCNPSDTPDLSNVSTLQEMFKNAGSNIPTLIIDNINKWDVSNIINMRSMFQSSPFKGNISNWNTSNVTRMDTMFNFNTLFNININSWDVSKVQFMQGMFNGATSFNQPLDNWTLRSAGVNINSIFRNASSFNQNINSWDISGVTNLQQLFSGATSFNKPLNNWDTSEVTNMDAVFKNASSFNQPLNNWNVSNVTTTSQMFQNATSFNQPLNSWETNAYSTTSNIENMSFMFDNATSFIASLNSWDTSGATNINYMFRNINDSGGNIDVSNWDVSNVTQARYTFAYNPLSSLDITNWDVSSITNMQGMFQGTNIYNFLTDIKEWDLSNLTNAALFMAYYNENAPRFFPNSKYDDILNAFANETYHTTPTNLTISFGKSVYTTAAATSRTTLITPVSSGGFGWTITDGGAA